MDFNNLLGLFKKNEIEKDTESLEISFLDIRNYNFLSNFKKLKKLKINGEGVLSKKDYDYFNSLGISVLEFNKPVFDIKVFFPCSYLYDSKKYYFIYKDMLVIIPFLNKRESSKVNLCIEDEKDLVKLSSYINIKNIKLLNVFYLNTKVRVSFFKDSVSLFINSKDILEVKN